jgi:uncharacterized membrane protein
MTRMERAMAALSLAGLAVAGYLTWVHYAEVEPWCTSFSDCVRVQSSAYADLAGVPVALIGLAGYASILGSLFIRGELGLLLTAFLTLVGVGFSAYLTWAEIFWIEAICQWCVVSAVLMTTLAALAFVRLLRAPPDAGEAR